MKRIFLFMLFLPLFINAQTITILDKSTNKPIEDVVISGDNTSVSLFTKNNGTADIARLAGAETIHLYHINYQFLTIKKSELSTIDYTVLLEPKPFNIGEVLVKGTVDKNLKTPGSISQITPREFYRYNDINLSSVLNTIPGVKMEQRSSMAQSHILIRGLGGKSRFNMRDVKVYYNGVPLTDADGTTTMNDIDFSAFGSAQIFKGPSALLYGSAIGGAINFFTKKAHYRELDLNEVALIGSDGLFRNNFNYRAGTENANLFVNYGYQNYDGYREHSSSKRNYFTFSGDFNVSDNQSVSFLTLVNTVKDQFAGEVDSIQYTNTPRSANPAYIQKGIGLDGKSFLAGITHTYNFGNEFQNTSTIFTGYNYTVSPIEPYINRTSASKIGGRTLFSFTPVIAGLKTSFVLGAELTRNYNLEKHYSFTPAFSYGALNFDREYDLVSYNSFLQASVDLSSVTSITGGFRINGANYTIVDLLRATNDYSGRRTVKPYVTPVISINHNISEAIQLYGLVSTGYSAPTVSEILLPNGSINENLLPEKSIDYEIGSKGTLLDGQFAYNADVYYMQLKDSYVSQILNGITYQVNAGKSNNYGVEAAASYNVLSVNYGVFTAVRPFASYSYTNYKYKEYTLSGTDYSGNLYPGVSPHLFTVGLDITTKPGFYLYSTLYYADKRALNDANSRWIDAYTILNTKVGYRQRLMDYFTLHVYAGADNLLNTLNSPTVAVNQTAPAGTLAKYFNAAPGRNYYAALNIEFHFDR